MLLQKITKVLICLLNWSFEIACIGNVTTKVLVIIFDLLFNFFILKGVHTKRNNKKVTIILICFWIVLLKLRG